MADEFDDGLFPEEQSDDIEETAGIFDDDYDELDEIVLEEEGSRSNRPFFLSLLGLISVAILAPLCLVISQLSGFISEPTPSVDMLTREANVAFIVATNEAVATLNAYVTQTVDARNATSTAIANQPTETPTPTITPTPTNTAVPDTSLANTDGGETEGAEDPDAADEDDSSLGDSDRTTSDNVDGSTDEAEAQSGSGSSSDSSSDSSSNDTSDSSSGVTDENTTSANSDSTAADTSDATAAAPEQLPETGFSMASTIALALGLLVLLFGARRLRQA